MLEIERPRRPRQKSGKSDQLDAIAAVREALAAGKPAMPRLRGAREALRILLTTREGALKAPSHALSQLHALVVGAPEMLRCRLRRLGTAALVTRCSQLRQHQPQQCIELQVTIQALRSVARCFGAEVKEKSDREIRRCLKRHLARRVIRLLKGIDTP